MSASSIICDWCIWCSLHLVQTMALVLRFTHLHACVARWLIYKWIFEHGNQLIMYSQYIYVRQHVKVLFLPLSRFRWYRNCCHYRAMRVPVLLLFVIFQPPCPCTTVECFFLRLYSNSSLAPFQPLVNELSEPFKPGTLPMCNGRRFMNGAITALQTACEYYITELNCKANLCAITAKRVTIQPKGIKLVCWFRCDDEKAR